MQLIKRHMKIKSDLLEIVCQNIIDELASSFHHLDKIEITIRKLDPLIENFKGSLEVKMIQKL